MIELQSRMYRTDENVHSLAGMIALWERLLNIAPIRGDDEFFDLGGDSLQALHLFHEIESLTGRALPITAIYEAATPARLVALLDSPTAMAFSPLVLLKPGSGTPLFIAHGIGGNVIELKKLGQSIQSPRPVYAIQAKGVDGGDRPLDTIADMVEFYLPHVRAVQPRGPYHLAGYSFGGMVAMEMARRLEAEGEAIALLGFIDSFPHPNTFPKSVRHIVRLRSVTRAFRIMPLGKACRFVLAKLKAGGDGALLTGAIQAKFIEDGADAVSRTVYDSAFAALTAYRPRYYPGRVEFFRPENSIFPVAPARIWGKFLGGLRLHIVPGDHSRMVRDDVAPLAAALSRSLRDATGAA